MRNQPPRRKLPELERKKVLKLSIETLHSTEGKDALDYLNLKREFPNNIINIFRLGYVPSHVHNIYGDFHEFAGRIVLPIHDPYGELVALSSRDWRENAYSKFFHEQFKKSNYLYALDIAKDSIIKNNKAVIVEGEFDVMKMHSVGIKCTVGMLGSSLSIKQISLLSRYCQEVFLMFDGDEPGKKSMERAIQFNIKYGLRKFYDILMIPVLLPDNLDPDDFIKKEGKNSLIDLLKKSKTEIMKKIGD